MRTSILSLVLASALAACGSSDTCQTTACPQGSTTKTYQICASSDAKTATLNFGSDTCSYTAADSQAAQVCVSKVATYCSAK